MDIFLDPALKRGSARALFEQLRDGMTSGRLAAGDRLPPSRELAERLGVSRSTVTTVYSRLAAEGFVDGRAGGGSFVTDLVAPSGSRSKPTALRPVCDLPVRPAALSDASVLFDLRSGRPDASLFPRREWRQCLSLATLAPPPSYGDPGGLPELRRMIAHWIGASRSVVVEPDDVVITNGAQQAIDLSLRLLARAGERIAIEEPGYSPVRDLCRALSLVPVPVPVDRDGIVVAAIPDNVRLVYTTPSHQSPTGATMSLERRRALLRFAEERDVAIIEDDYDSEYRHVDRPLEPLHLLDRSGRVIYVGTFSKTLTPSLRLGFAALPHSLAPAAVTLRRMTDAQPPSFTQLAMVRFIAEGHLDRHLRRTRRIYRDRHEIAVAFLASQHALGRLAPIGTNYAGLHIAVHLTTGQTEAEVAAAAAKAGIVLGNFAECWMTADPPPGLIIGFGNADAAQLSTALATLGDLLS